MLTNGFETRQKQPSSVFSNITEQTCFETIISMHFLCMLSSPVNPERDRIEKVSVCATATALYWPETLETALRKHGLHFLFSFSALYMCYDEPRAQFIVVSKFLEGCSTLQKKISLHIVGLLKAMAEGINTKPGDSKKQQTPRCPTFPSLCPIFSI